MSLAPGRRIGTYQVTAPLGAGGMGEVYRARDTRLGREVAVKVLPAAVASNPERLARFEREARAVAGLNHPNIVTLFSVEDEEGIRFLTMELVEGQSLDKLITQGGLPLSRVLDLALPLANALVAAHERGVVHRDLKPGNVMVTHDDWVKVLDFGLAKMAQGDAAQDVSVGATAAAPLSGEGQVLGTVPYMAPEQIRGEAVDARSDLFSLGVILYELATGRRPFAGASSADVSSAILRDAPTPVVSLRADLPRDLNRIIARCLEKNPRDRFQTARDVYNELRYVRRELDSGAITAAPAPAMSSGSGAMPSPLSPPPYTPPPSSPPPQSPAPRPPSSGLGSGSMYATGEMPSIAVLPFVNRSRGEEDEYFSDGLADELLNLLTKVRGLRVAARASSFQFQGKNEDLAVIGEKLNAATLLDGSVRKSGSRVRISVQLVKAADRVQLWSETYDRSLDDIFAVQDDIAQSVVKELRTTLLGGTPDSDAARKAEADVSQAAKGHGTNAEAHRLYLQGKYLIERVTEQDTVQGMRYLEQALALDPTHALAWTEIARAHINRAGYGWDSTIEGYRKAREATTRALQLSPNLAEGYMRLSAIQRTHDWDWKGAETAARRALELAPGNAEAMRSMAGLLHMLGRYEEANRLYQKAVDLDPLSAAGYRAIALNYRSMDRFPEAAQAIRKGLELSPQHVGAHMLLSIIVGESGNWEEALQEAKQESAEWARLTAMAYALSHLGHHAEADQAIAELKAKFAVDAPYQVAAMYAANGKTEEMFAWLDRAVAEKDAGVAQVKCERVFRPYHSDPRWPALLRTLRFNEA